MIFFIIEVQNHCQKINFSGWLMSFNIFDIHLFLNRWNDKT